MGTEVCIALVTAPDSETAERVGRTLVEERLAACVNILPGVVSVYRWEGRVVREGEVLAVLKTTCAAGKRLVQRVRELHPYDVPEVLILNVDEGSAPYLDWVVGEVAEIHGA
ncbi:MAG: divalent-cation tolerance protein CutA [Gemmatimonadota bacterium]